MPDRRKPLCLALQGGGSHGAYTWGVLDALLADGRFAVGAVSGTSAGALNAAALVQGLAEGGAQGARDRLRRLWTAVGSRSPFRVADLVTQGPAAPFLDPVFVAGLETLRLAGQFVSPYLPGIPVANLLETIVREVVDVGVLHAAPVPLFVSATNVRTGDLRVFSGKDLGFEALLASCCLPDLFQAVEIDGEAYWDGGFIGNPSLKPLLDLEDGCPDILVVQVTPFAREALPREVPDIMSRVMEITFNASLLRELADLSEGQRHLREAELHTPAARRIAGVRLHFLPAPHELGDLGTTSKLDTRPSHLDRLCKLGRQAGLRWLASRDADAVGERSSLDLDALRAGTTSLGDART